MNARVVTLERAALIVVTGIVFEHDTQFETQMAGVIVRGYFNPRTYEILIEAPLPQNQVKLLEQQITYKHNTKPQILEILKSMEKEIDEIWKLHENKVSESFDAPAMAKAEESLWW